jgi:hypothetical protein
MESRPTVLRGPEATWIYSGVAKYRPGCVGYVEVMCPPDIMEVFRRRELKLPGTISGTEPEKQSVPNEAINTDQS